MKPKYYYNDGGREEAGFKGDTGDCVTRSIAIASGLPYKEVYDALALLQKGRGETRSARNGVQTKNKPFKDYMKSLGFSWVPLMGIGTGCKVHLTPEELPHDLRLVLSVSKHMAAWINGKLHDTYNCSRGGTRCVYGYWVFEGDHQTNRTKERILKPNIKRTTDKQCVEERCKELEAQCENIGGGVIEILAPDGKHWFNGDCITLFCISWKDALDRMEDGLERCSPDNPECLGHCDFEKCNLPPEKTQVFL